MTLLEQYKQDILNNRWTMPDLEIIAVFVSKQDWMQYEFSNHTRSRPFVITTGEAFVVIALDVNSAVWLALQTALKRQGEWIPVGKVVVVE